ncbi:uncharacterized protein LOC129343079 isoform X2 [Eublepharis macularius]|uniref:Uncharacterized protein LOC129343079 isoform X2 n=1 Tax=Eublepharis macularius TaxID=481883 RepID=A0AA97KDT4_EUBMA|nr:uncharacterized protein LOC129343079 isoform X2 [Eublepharis macularius]
MERSKEEELQELLASCSQFEQFLFFTLRDQVSKDKTTEEEPLPRLSPFELVLLFYLKSLVYSEKSIQETLVHQDTRCKSVITERKAWRGFQQEFQVHSVMLKETESDLHKTTIKETEVQSGEGQSLPSFPEGFFTQAKHAERDQAASSGTQTTEEEPLPRLSPFELVLLFYLKSLVYSEKSIQETLVHQDTRCKSVITERKAWRGFQQEFQVHSVMLKETESDLHKTTIKETEVQSGEGQSLPSFPEGFFTQAKHAERDQAASSGTQA